MRRVEGLFATNGMAAMWSAQLGCLKVASMGLECEIGNPASSSLLSALHASGSDWIFSQMSHSRSVVNGSFCSLLSVIRLLIAPKPRFRLRAFERRPQPIVNPSFGVKATVAKVGSPFSDRFQSLPEETRHKSVPHSYPRMTQSPPADPLNLTGYEM